MSCRQDLQLECIVRVIGIVKSLVTMVVVVTDIRSYMY